MISGYRDLSQGEIDAINDIKQAEKILGQLWNQITEEYSADSVDARWMSIAKTHFEQGFMAFCRAIARPEERF